ncbi:MAG: HAD family hydrolase [Lachnospiraceae bacterium]|nr:HAD family hydrolase [Lachnospiraceae bacterium]
MIKAIFIDYTGTMVLEDEPYTRELLGYFIGHSNMNDPREVLKVVWGKIKEYEALSHGDDFIRNDDRIDKILAYCVENCGLEGDLDYMHETWRKIWVHAPLHDDVKPFFERSDKPVYVLSNDDLCYLEESMKEKELSPAGIISAEIARSCKPDRKIFEKALEMADASPDEVMFIGDSITSDVTPALELGIAPVLIVRSKDADVSKVPEKVRVIRSLDEL